MPKSLPQNTQIIAERGRRKAKIRESISAGKRTKKIPQITQNSAEGKGEKQLSNSKIKQVDAQEKMPKSLPQITQIDAEG